ncbi:putative uncharacterized protein [Pseudomonas sp. StFLB209]|uniref:hypothetical protein n=1 Tax=Pseudomonas sp. StFLB209 TaxID=1028989 RepID=UPI0004F812F2|nr:hypothetical protein [Pseudomonas sp. StFLB209]BAP41314.1 putative uncharacterized protein [Pseudomonas sp. StFLB209]
MSLQDRDFQDTLKAAALQFLQRHHAEHLTYDYHLADRAAIYLVTNFNLLDTTAERIVALAVNDLIALRDRQRVDLTRSTSTHTIIIDPETGTTWSIPAALIFERIIGSPDSTRYRVANS